MDIPRPEAARARRRRRIIGSTIALLVVAGITMGLQRLKPAAPSVDGGTLYRGTVKRGEMLRQVRGNGTLVPEDIRWIPAQSQGRIEEIKVLPGAEVEPDTILLVLSNPELEQAAFDAQWQVKAAEAELANLKVQLESQRLNQQAAAATAMASFNRAKLDLEVNEELAKSGLIPQLTLRQSRANADELRKLAEIEESRFKMSAESTKAQLAVQAAKVEQQAASLRLKQQQVDSLKVRATIHGVLQKLGDTMMLQKGQQVALGANLARVANPMKLKAEIKVVETQAKDIVHGQLASIDTRNGIIAGKVSRIDPSVQNGTVTVDVALEGELPKGARPDLSVDGTIELERLTNVMFVDRMVHGGQDSTITVFKVVPGTREAMRVPVKLGRISVQTVEILQGLNVGDEIILSDMSTYDNADRVRLN